MLALSDIPEERRSKAEYWLEFIRDQNASGLTVKKYCDERHVNSSTFYCWLHYLKGKSQASSQVIHKKSATSNKKDSAKKFIAMKLESELNINTSTNRVLSGITLCLNHGLSVQLDVDFYQATLLRLIKGLR